MEIDIFKQFITLYGPLGAGWVGWLWERRRAAKREDKVLGVLIDNTKAITTLAIRLEK